MSRLLFHAAALALVAFLVGTAGAADPAFDKALRDSLADVHNKGADIYNQGKDYAGAYRLYEGALRTSRPLLTHRPATQKVIDESLTSAGRESDPARKAFLLHEAIEKVRADLKNAGAVTPEPKKTVTPVPEPKKTPTPEPKKGAAAGPGVKGVVTYMGKPVANADLLFVSLDRPAPVVAAAKTGADGTYSLPLAPGRYAVTVAAAANGKNVLPPRFMTTDTSGLTVTVAAGGTAFDIALQ